MKYSNYLGAFFSLGIIAACFLPWVYIEPIDALVSGLKADKTNFGKPGIVNIVLTSFIIVLFLTPRIWAKRLNVFICTVNIAWTLRNYLLVTQCELGECPEKKLGIYLLILFSIIVFVLSFLPKMKSTAWRQQSI